MNKIDYDKYSTEELREMLTQLIDKISDVQCREILIELKKN